MQRHLRWWPGWLGVLAACQSASVADCHALVMKSAWAEAAKTCDVVVTATNSPEARADLARALLITRRTDEAARQAQLLLAGPARGEGLWVQAQLAVANNALTQAATLYAQALELHRAQQKHGLASRDAFGLMGVYRDLGDLERAQAFGKIAADEVRLEGDRRMLSFTEIGRADVLRRAGDRSGAEQILFALLAECAPGDRSWVLLKQGLLYRDLGLPALARAPVERALEIERASASPNLRVLRSAELSLAGISRELGKFVEGFAHLDRAEALQASPFHVQSLRAEMLVEGGQLAEAAKAYEVAQRALPPDDKESAWDLLLSRGDIAERLGQPEAALTAFKASAAIVSDLHAHAGALGPQLLATHREPFLRAFGVLARAGRWPEALEIVAQLDTNALLASLAAPVAKGAETPATPISATEGRAVAPPAPVSAGSLLRAWSGRHLVVLLADGASRADTAKLWRLEVDDGVVRGEVVGEAAALEAAAARLEADPTLPVAEQLGAALVPRTKHPVELLLVGPIARTPLAVLRRDGALIIAQTPLARVLGMVPRPPRPNVPAGPALVVGDPRDDLPAARAEVREVARLLKVEPHVGSAVTLDLLRSGLATASVLHLAAHGELSSTGAQLLLGGDSVATAAQVAQLPGAPSLVVLASCGAAAARDDAGWGSLAAAFLTAGAQHVVASPWVIGDATTLEVVREFYAHGGAKDPVRGLAQAQLALADRLPPREWAGFTVLVGPPEQQ